MMNTKPIWPLLMILTVITPIHAQETSNGDTGRPGSLRRAGGPPPEAYAACANSADGDEAIMTDHSGESISGVCKPEGKRLVLRPYRNVNDRPGMPTSRLQPDSQ
jgi:hypothetical protein